MTPDCTDEPERNNGHHQQRPAVGPEYPGQDQVDQDQSKNRAALHVAQGLPLVGLPAFEGEFHSVASFQCGHGVLFQVRDDPVVVVDCVVYVAGYGYCKFAFDVTDGVKTPPALQGDDVGEGHRAAAGQEHLEFVKAIEPVAFAVREYHAHFDFITLIGHHLHQVALVSGAQLPTEVLDGQTQGLTRGRQAQYKLFASVRHVVLNAGNTGDVDQHILEIHGRRLHARKTLAGDLDLQVLARRTRSGFLDR